MKQQKGFTLIELIMVIVILGILAAFALPRFANFSNDARESVFEGAVGAARSAIGITRSASLVAGNETEDASTTPTVTLDGTAVPIVFGYPTLAGLATAAQFDGIDYDAATGIITVGTCVATYTPASAATTPATLAVTTAPSPGC